MSLKTKLIHKSNVPLDLSNFVCFVTFFITAQELEEAMLLKC